ncbi:MAG: SNARE associated Golgi protein [Acidobacteria bacterium ADurb.Bin051]|jgi:uncharacterized membrane protein YdjX (TVP38/TMEM64 family)|nr:MAG: SNARE associated Golgi protein [Acidobacteria bacterium ADurb.Bin051]
MPVSRPFSAPSAAEREGLPAAAVAAGEAGRRWLGWGGLALLAGLALLLLARPELREWQQALAFAEGYAGRWWFAPALALVTALLFGASLPGSAVVWVAGLLLPPAVAVPTFVAGAVAGSCGAYWCSRQARAAGSPAARGRFARLFAARSDFPTLLALRLAPGIPHAALNLGAGYFGVPPGRFAASTALGLALKGGLYITAIHRAARLETLAEALRWPVLAPLALLALLLLFGPRLRARARAHDREATRLETV